MESDVANIPAVITAGLHIVDILGRPVTHIPEGQGLALLDEIAMTIAGTAAATAMDLSRLGIKVYTFGVVGDDHLGAWLKSQLTREGVDTAGLRVDSSRPTSATMLPIRPNGERPALHVTGANASLVASDVLWDHAAHATHLHVGGSLLLEGLDGEPTAGLFQEAKSRGLTTSLDIIGVPDRDYEKLFGVSYPNIDFLLVNDDDVMLLSGKTDVESAIDAMLGKGVGACVVTVGAEGALYRDSSSQKFERPALAVDVVDTTGCGDAFSAGFIAGAVLGETMTRCVEMGIASGSAVARGLGSDAGVQSLEELTDFMEEYAFRH
jgi:sugar/nucleoside kinase (ribokinase family)